MQQNSILGYFQKQRQPKPENSGPGQPYDRQPQSESSSRYKSHGRHHNRRHRGPDPHRNPSLKQVADETKIKLSELLVDIPSFDAMESLLHDFQDLDPLDPRDCPNFVLPSGDPNAGKTGTRIGVYNMDSFDAALQLDPNYKVHTHLGVPPPILSLNATPDNNNMESDGKKFDDMAEDTATFRLDSNTEEKPEKAANHLVNRSNSNFSRRASVSTKKGIVRPVAVLNLASERSPGGGWQNGTLAQEESLCYRSSLYLSLHRSYYPFHSLSAIHSPSVVLIRDGMSRGHTLLTKSEHPLNLPVTSVISVAALRRPHLSDDRKTFHSAWQRSETKRKIRLTLRLAALQGHTRLVLGALGCGVFANPPKEVADCFLEVLREQEFQGGWWEEIAFAVLDNARGENGGKDGSGNFGVFYRVLDGQVV